MLFLPKLGQQLSPKKLIATMHCYYHTKQNYNMVSNATGFQSASLVEQSVPAIPVIPEKTVKIVSMDGCEFHIPYSQAVLCDFFKKGIDGYDADDANEVAPNGGVASLTHLDADDANEVAHLDVDLVFELSGCPSTVLSRIINFLEKYVDSPFEELPKPLNADLKELLPEWYFAFLGLGENANADYVSQCATLLLHAQYVECVPLVSLLSACLSTIFKNCKSVKEVCQLSGIERDIAEPVVEDIEKFKTDYPHLYNEYDPFQVLRELQAKRDCGTEQGMEQEANDDVDEGESEEEEDD
jgi:hypothetical protein